jgi:hypothetical protein
VLVAEGWMSNRDFSSPSADSKRKEVVLLTSEGYGCRKHNVLVVEWSKSGKVRGFKQFGRRMCDHVEGRFSNILPAQPLTPEAETEAKRVLDAIGMTPQCNVKVG